MTIEQLDLTITNHPIKLTPAQAAKIIGSNACSVRERMKRNVFNPPIGTVYQTKEKRKTYQIFPEALADCIHIDMNTLWERLNA